MSDLQSNGYYWMRKPSGGEFRFGQVLDARLPGGLAQMLWMIPTLRSCRTIERLPPDVLIPSSFEVGAVVTELLRRTSDRRRRDEVFDVAMSRVFEHWFDEHNAGKNKGLSCEQNVVVIIDATERYVDAVLGDAERFVDTFPNDLKRLASFLLKRAKNCQDMSRSGGSVGIQ